PAEPGRYHGRRMGGVCMRRFVTGVLALVLVAAGGMVTGHAAHYGPQQTAVVVGDISDAITQDPNLMYERADTVPAHQMYSTLVAFTRGNLTQVHPLVAQAWEVSKDVRIYTFHLRHGVV